MDSLSCISRCESDGTLAESVECAWLASYLNGSLLTCKTLEYVDAEPLCFKALCKSPVVVRIDLEFNRCKRSTLECHDFLRNCNVCIYRILVRNVRVRNLDIVQVPTLLVWSC